MGKSLINYFGMQRSKHTMVRILGAKRELDQKDPDVPPPQVTPRETSGFPPQFGRSQLADIATRSRDHHQNNRLRSP